MVHTPECASTLVFIVGIYRKKVCVANAKAGSVAPGEPAAGPPHCSI